MARASSRPDPAPGAEHAAIAERLIASGDPDYHVLQEGYWPDRTIVLGAIDRLHRLLMAESLPDTRAGESAAARIAREIADIEAALVPQFHLAFELPARLGETGAQGVGIAAAEARRVVEALLAKLPELRERIFDDARAAWRNDPSCRHPIEALYAYPGVFAITRHRIAHILYQLEVPLLPRLIAEDAHRRTGIDINAGAQIGREFFIDHGTGVVIGETAVVGDRVTLYQGVTLGAKSFQVDKSTGRLVKGVPRHPIVEDDVTIYASATVLGRITVGRGSIIGGNVWLTHSVPPNSRVAQAAPQQSGFTDGAGI
ncbi:MAG TPA: serine O-acetyltransferase EpsC [Steroidobacteraceae bacterium]|nr:serine O-acetyltransferase EpsC [Steroidobacteraceae bacterium]